MRQLKDGEYRSGFERRFASYLVSQGICFDYERDKIPYIVPPKERKYLVDFTTCGIYIETKGRLTSADRKKYLQVKESNPDIDLRFVFQKDNRIYKGSKTYYSDWAEKNGFKYHVGCSLPDEWLEEIKQAITDGKHWRRP